MDYPIEERIYNNWLDIWELIFDNSYDLNKRNMEKFNRYLVECLRNIRLLVPNNEKSREVNEELKEQIINTAININIIEESNIDKIIKLKINEQKDIFKFIWLLLYIELLEKDLFFKVGELYNPNINNFWSFIFSNNPLMPSNYILGYFIPQLFNYTTYINSTNIYYYDIAYKVLKWAWEYLYFKYFINYNLKHPIEEYWINYEIDWYPCTNPWIWFFLYNSDNHNKWNKLDKYLKLIINREKGNVVFLNSKFDFILQDKFIYQILQEKINKNIKIDKDISQATLINSIIKNKVSNIIILPYIILKKIYKFSRALLRNPEKISNFILIGHTGVGKTVFMAVSSCWLPYYIEKKDNNNLINELGNIVDIKSFTLEEKNELKAYLQKCFNALDQNKELPTGTDDMTNLIFEIKYKLLFFTKTVKIYTQDYRGSLSFLNREENIEERTKFFKLIEISDIILYFLDPSSFPELIPFERELSDIDIKNQFSNLDIICSFISQIKKYKKREKNIGIVITKSDKIPGFLKYIEKSKELKEYNSNIYKLLKSDYLKYNFNIMKYLILKKYKSKKSKFYNLEWARSLEIILNNLENIIKVMKKKLNIEIFFISSLGGIETILEKNPMTNKTLLKNIPKHPLQPYGVFPLLNWKVKNILEKY